MENEITQANVLQTQRILPYSPGEIYAAFADPARLAKWWGPNGFRNTFETFDFSVGGKWKFVMHGPDGTNYPNECMFKDIEAGEKVVVRHVSHPHFTLTVSLKPVDGGTQVQWVQAFDEAKVADVVRHIAEPGNEQNLERLQVLLRSEC